MIRHMSASIEGLLGLSDSKLGKLVGMPGKEARMLLKEKLQKGEKVIPCGECDVFDTVKGCPQPSGCKWQGNHNKSRVKIPQRSHAIPFI